MEFHICCQICGKFTWHWRKSTSSCDMFDNRKSAHVRLFVAICSSAILQVLVITICDGSHVRISHVRQCAECATVNARKCATLKCAEVCDIQMCWNVQHNQLGGNVQHNQLCGNLQQNFTLSSHLKCTLCPRSQFTETLEHEIRFSRQIITIDSCNIFMLLQSHFAPSV